MESRIESLLRARSPQNARDEENKIREIYQEIALYALSQAGFFHEAAFYGGSALRIFYGLPRFSEDLDFTLLSRDDAFSFADYFPALERVFASFGAEVVASEKEKIAKTDVRSAFLKENTIHTLLIASPRFPHDKWRTSNSLLRVKIEADTNPPAGFRTRFATAFEPAFFQARVLDEPSLFAGKIAALLTRNHKNRTKGRDYFDYLFLIGKGTKVNLAFLSAALKKAGIAFPEPLTIEALRQLLRGRFLKTDYDQVRDDIRAFVDQSEEPRWAADDFLRTLPLLEAEETSK
jgi:hypothetical protein